MSDSSEGYSSGARSVRSGLRAFGCLIVAANLASGTLCTYGFLSITADEGFGWSSLLFLISAVVTLSLCIFGIMRMIVDRRVAEISNHAVVLHNVPDPRFRVWKWYEIRRVRSIEQTVRGITVAVVYHFDLEPGDRSAAYLKSTNDTVPHFKATVFDVPRPRVISDYMYSVAPTQCLELIPPRRRPKGYPWREIAQRDAAERESND